MKYTEGQDKIIVTSRVALAVMVIVAFMAAVGWALVWFLNRTSSAVLPLVGGLFLALILRPVQNRIGGCLHCLWKNLKPGRMRVWLCAHERYLALVVLLALVLVVLTGCSLIIWSLGGYLVQQGSEIAEKIPNLMMRLRDWLSNSPIAERALTIFGIAQDQLNQLEKDPSDFILNFFSRIFNGNVSMSGFGLLRCFGRVGSLLMTCIFCICFLLMPELRLEDRVRGALGCFNAANDACRFYAQCAGVFVKTIVQYIQRQAVVCVCEGIAFGLGFHLLGLPYGFVIGLAQGLLNFIPFVGTIAMLPLFVPMAYFCGEGGIVMVVGVLMLWGVGQLFDAFIFPTVMHGREYRLNPVMVLFSFLFWGALLNSVWGVILAVPLTAFCKVFGPKLIERFLQKRLNGTIARGDNEN